MITSRNFKSWGWPFNSNRRMSVIAYKTWGYLYSDESLNDWDTNIVEFHSTNIWTWKLNPFSTRRLQSQDVSGNVTENPMTTVAVKEEAVTAEHEPPAKEENKPSDNWKHYMRKSVYYNLEPLVFPLCYEPQKLSTNAKLEFTTDLTIACLFYKLYLECRGWYFVRNHFDASPN